MVIKHLILYLPTATWIFLFIHPAIDNCTEIMDFGYPQNLSPEILKLYITQEGVRSPFSSKVRKIEPEKLKIYIELYDDSFVFL